MKKILVVVDFQKDFYDKNGALYVNGAENCVKPICDEIRSGKYDKVILTMDWHSILDDSFKKNGGIWPVHCVEYTEGSVIHPDIMQCVWDSELDYEIFLKGTYPSHEEYGAFEILSEERWGNNQRIVELKNFEGNSSVYAYEDEGGFDGIEFTICGLAGDYCCKSTYDNLKNHGFDVVPFYDGMAFIGEKKEY